jgi:hypothetical protein
LVPVFVVALALCWAGRATADVVAQTKVPLEGTPVTSPCSPDPAMVLHGDMHLVTRLTIGTGGNVHVGFSTNYQGVTASSLVDDTRYVCNETIEDEAQTLNPFPVVISETQDVHMTRQGSDTPDDDFVMHVTFHITINANGEPTAEVDDVTTDCR